MRFSCCFCFFQFLKRQEKETLSAPRISVSMEQNLSEEYNISYLYTYTHTAASQAAGFLAG